MAAYLCGISKKKAAALKIIFTISGILTRLFRKEVAKDTNGVLNQCGLPHFMRTTCAPTADKV
jgi:hypothetical protein